MLAVKNMKYNLVMKSKRTMIFEKGRKKERKKERKWSGKGTRQERNSHLLKRNEAGTKTSCIEKEGGRNEIVNLEGRSYLKPSNFCPIYPKVFFLLYSLYVLQFEKSYRLWTTYVEPTFMTPLFNFNKASIKILVC